MNKQIRILLPCAVSSLLLAAAIAFLSSLRGSEPDEAKTSVHVQQGTFEKHEGDVDFKKRSLTEPLKSELTEEELVNIRKRAAAAGVELPDKYKAKASDAFTLRSQPSTDPIRDAYQKAFGGEPENGNMTPSQDDSALRLVESRLQRLQQMCIEELKEKQLLLVPNGKAGTSSQPDPDYLQRLFGKLAAEGTISNMAYDSLKSGEIEVIYARSEGEPQWKVVEIREADLETPQQ